MRPTDAAEALQVSIRSVYTMIDRGELRACRIGTRTVRVYRDQIEEIIAGGAANAAAE